MNEYNNLTFMILGNYRVKADCNICYQKLDILQAVNTLVPAAL